MSSTLLAISLIVPSTSDSQIDTSLIAPCCLNIAAAITPDASWLLSRTDFPTRLKSNEVEIGQGKVFLSKSSQRGLS